MIDCKNYHPIIKLNKCKFDERYLQKNYSLLFYQVVGYSTAWWPVGSGSVPWPLRSSPGWRIADNWGDRGLDWAARLEIEAWGRHIKGGNLFHLRIRLSWPRTRHTVKVWLVEPGQERPCSRAGKRRSTRRFVITEKAPTRAFCWLKAPISAFTFKIKTLLRHYAKRTLIPQ